MSNAVNTTQSNMFYPVANAVASSNPFVWTFEARDPNVNDVNYPIQKLWLNTSNDGIWFLKNFTSPGGVIQANWIFLATGGLLLQTISDTANTPVFPTASGDPVPNNIQLVGSGGVTIVSDPPNNLLTISTSGGVTEEFAMQAGTSPVVPAGNLVTFNGSSVSAGTVPVQTRGTGPNTMQLEVQTSQAIAATNATNIGLAAFNSAQFSVDANGFVSLIGGGVAIDSINVDASTPPGTDPVVPDGAGQITVTGAQVAAGTTTNVIRTDSLAANTYTIEIQRSQAVASSTIGDNGVSHYDSSAFAVDANGFVTLAGGGTATTKINVDASTPPGTDPVIPDGSGIITMTGAQVATGTIGANVIRTDSLAANSLTIEIQRSTAVAATDSTKNGVSHYDSVSFAVDSNGFVSMTGGGGFTWVDQSGSFTAAKNTGYFITGTATANLPASPAQGDTIKFFVDHASQVLTIDAPGSQIIRLGSLVSSAGGTATSTLQGDSVELVYRSSNTCWEAVCGFSGTWIMA